MFHRLRSVRTMELWFLMSEIRQAGENPDARRACAVHFSEESEPEEGIAGVRKPENIQTCGRSAAGCLLFFADSAGHIQIVALDCGQVPEYPDNHVKWLVVCADHGTWQ